ncbi:MAG: hypothetical protein L3K02_07030 [Thermoplasmata archaeon]|nr:hypothetical protein [Thermoplasmata archaeon]
MDTRPPQSAGLKDQIESSLNDSPDRPICVHGLYETIKEADPAARREDMVESVRAAAEDLVQEGHAQHAYVSAIAIGAHCEDEVFWSSRSPNQHLEEFGPEFEQLAVARRLASHFECHGL